MALQPALEAFSAARAMANLYIKLPHDLFAISSCYWGLIWSLMAGPPHQQRSGKKATYWAEGESKAQWMAE
jgi:hypothetical protein